MPNDEDRYRIDNLRGEMTHLDTTTGKTSTIPVEIVGLAELVIEYVHGKEIPLITPNGVQFGWMYGPDTANTRIELAPDAKLRLVKKS